MTQKEGRSNTVNLMTITSTATARVTTARTATKRGTAIRAYDRKGGRAQEYTARNATLVRMDSHPIFCNKKITDTPESKKCERSLCTSKSRCFYANSIERSAEPEVHECHSSQRHGYWLFVFRRQSVVTLSIAALRKSTRPCCVVPTGMFPTKISTWLFSWGFGAAAIPPRPPRAPVSRRPGAPQRNHIDGG